MMRILGKEGMQAVTRTKTADLPVLTAPEVHRQPEVGSALPCRMPNGSDQEDGANREGGEHTLAEDASQPRATAE